MKKKYTIHIYKDQCSIQEVYNYQNGFVYFKTKELAEKAIGILGIDIIKSALS